MNNFIAINSNGGYLGRWFWTNTGTLEHNPSAPDFYGSVGFMPTIRRHETWAGSIGILRYLVLRSLQR